MPFGGYYIFAHRLARVQSDGGCTREPGPIDYSYRRVRLGDVGYTRDGSFHLLFSAGEPLGSRELGVDVPHTFEPLDVKYVKKYVKKNNRPPGYLRTETVRKIGAEVGGSSAIPWCVRRLFFGR